MHAIAVPIFVDIILALYVYCMNLYVFVCIHLVANAKKVEHILRTKIMNELVEINF